MQTNRYEVDLADNETVAIGVALGRLAQDRPKQVDFLKAIAEKFGVAYSFNWNRRAKK